MNLLFATAKARKLDEWVERLVDPLLYYLGLQHLEVNGLYVVFGLLALCIYSLAIWAHIKNYRRKQAGIERTEEQEDFLAWVTASAVTLTVVGTIIAVYETFWA